MRLKEINHVVQADTYEASMALNQLLRIGQHAIKLHNLIKDEQEMESWVAKKIDLAGDYVKKVYNYMTGVKAGMYEDAGEGHMSKSTLYHTAKYAIQLMQMIKKGDDLEGWVQSKLNKAADYLQGTYNYEEYQKLSPYREDLDGTTFSKHKEIIKKNIDEILSKETDLDDTDTKPGMMRILGKRVNDVEKEMSKKMRKEPPVLDKDFDDQPRYKGQRMDVGEKHGGEHSTSGRSMSKGEMNKREKIVKAMKKDKAGFKKRYGKDADAVMYATATKQAMGEDKYEFRGNPFPILGKAESYLNYGSDMAKAIMNNNDNVKAMAQTYLDRVPSFVNTEMKEIFPKSENANEYADKPRQMKDPNKEVMMQKDGNVIVIDKDRQKEYTAKGYELAETLDEGLKDTLQKLAAAGVIVGTMAGAGSMINALDNSVPAVKAMNTAYSMAVDAGNEELAKMIKNDISAVKVRLSSGKDLNFVKSMQDKYSKFLPTEGLTYESKLAVMLNQQLK